MVMTNQTIIEQVKLPNETLFAWTSVGDYRYYPQFVNVSRKDGRIVISVRSLEDTTGEHPRTGNQAVAALPDEEVQRLVTALQSSAVLPSEAITPEMIEAGAEKIKRLLRLVPGSMPIEADIAAREIYTAMRAATPTAPVQDDDAAKLVRSLIGDEGSDLIIDVDAGIAADKATLAYVANLLARRAARLSPTPETGLVEALKSVRKRLVAAADHQCTMRGDYLFKGHPDAWIADSINEIDTALSNVSLSDEEKNDVT